MDDAAHSPGGHGASRPFSHRLHFQTPSSPVDEDRAGPLPYLRRQSTSLHRSSSIRTDSSTRPSMGPGASTDSLLLPRATSHEVEHDEVSWWHSAPLLFAVVPAIGGVVFQSGSIFVTDLALLILAALYLNWCLVTPWVWYRSAQSVKLATPAAEDQSPLETAIEDVVDEFADPIPQKNEWDSSVEPGTPSGTNPTPLPTGREGPETNDALRELRLHEITALALCFLGPLLGSYILHVIRLQLSTLGDQLVSNLHLTLFVLGAEIRPLRHAIKMAQARTLYLQRVVREDPHASVNEDDPALQDLRQRLDEVEESLAKKFTAIEHANGTSKTPESTDALKKMQAAMQSQIDALNRAVRRYEKRATAQTMQTESRLQDLDVRLREAVSLAAAAANYSQRPGLVVGSLNSLKSLLAMPVRLVYTVLSFPFRIASEAIIEAGLKLGLVQSRRTRRPIIKTVPRSKTAQAGPGRKVQK